MDGIDVHGNELSLSRAYSRSNSNRLFKLTFSLLIHAYSISHFSSHSSLHIPADQQRHQLQKLASIVTSATGGKQQLNVYLFNWHSTLQLQEQLNSRTTSAAASSKSSPHIDHTDNKMFPRRRRTSSEPAFRVVFRSASPSAPLRAAALRTLQQELAELQSGPSTDGFRVACDENNLFKWTVAIFGPPDTLFQGGYFKATITFPPNYPQSPPTMRFVPPLWHPNVYKSGELCISILHAPGDDQLNGELATERWGPQQNVRTVLLSVISLLNDPNTESPANVDAAISYRHYRENTDQKYARIVRRQVEKSKADAQRDGVVVPETVDEYQGLEKREGERVALIRLRDIFAASDSLDDLLAEDEATTAQNSSSHSTMNSSSSNSSAENVLNNNTQQQNNNNADNAIVNGHNLANANNNDDGPDPEQQERIRALQDELAALINNLIENGDGGAGDGGAAAEEPRGEDNNANALLVAGNDPALQEEGTNDEPRTARVHSEPLLIIQGEADPIDMRTAHGIGTPPGTD